jgi:integrase
MVPTVEAVTDKVASAYKTALLSGGVHRATANQQLAKLRVYWRWLAANGHAPGNPWLGKSVPQRRRDEEEKERPFTDAEVRALFAATDDAHVRDVMRLAALTGMRLEELFRLTVADTEDGGFKVRRSKTAAGTRVVPIHSALVDTVARLTAGKAPGDYLIDARSGRKDGRRSGGFSHAFGRLREMAGVGDKDEGRRRSRANFHSWRRWFATRAEQAGHHEHLVARVVGHRVQGLTFGTYSGGASLEQLRAVVESVNLPEGV